MERAREESAAANARRNKIADPTAPEWYGVDEDGVLEIVARLPLKLTQRLGRLSKQMRRVGARALERQLALNPEQAAAFLDAMRGHSIFLTGGAGVGKSHTLQVIRSYLSEGIRRTSHDGRAYHDTTLVTASTGCAAAILGAQTLHSALQIGIGNGQYDTYVAKIVREKPYHFERLRQLQTLVVDEAGMLDGRTFHKAAQIVGWVRERGVELRNAKALTRRTFELLPAPRPFGGAQVIVCGDFLQLPPVEKTHNGWIFECASWPKLELRNHVLTTVQRQQGNTAFVHALNRMRMGEGTQADLDYLAANAAQGEPPADALRLFARNVPAANVNSQRFDELCGYEPGVDGKPATWKTMPTRFDAIDAFPGTTGPSKPTHLLEHCPASKVLYLAVGARVMCLKNIETVDGRMVNGSVGTVTSFHPERDNRTNKIVGMGVAVRFDGVLGARAFEHMFRTHAAGLPPSTENLFTVSEGKSVKAQRVQLPLRLAWAVRPPCPMRCKDCLLTHTHSYDHAMQVSIHKSQGMSLDTVYIDFQGTFEEGQAYTALSRVRSLAGAWIRNLQLKHLRMASGKCKRWYEALA